MKNKNNKKLESLLFSPFISHCQVIKKSGKVSLKKKFFWSSKEVDTLKTMANMHRNVK